jgi:REP element-mobilizing transposase RayT
MPRKPRIHVPGAFYHVTMRGNHRQDIFFSEDDRRMLSSIAAEVTERYGARVHAYCWMTNHIHIAIQVGDIPLGRVMLVIGSRYARQVQARFKTTGHLFECRYFAVLVDADEYLLQLIRYIHLNPVDVRMAATPDDYLWSSHHVYRGLRDEKWVTTDFALAMLHPDRSRAVIQYRRWIEGSISQSHELPLDELNPNDRRVLGCDAFLASSLGLAWRPKSRKTLEMIVDEAVARFGEERTTILSTSRRRDLGRIRAWIANECTTLSIASLAQVARLFGRDESTLRESVKRYHGR